MIHYFFISFIAFLSNIPLGYFRKNYPKFSLPWFVLIHASIPLIIWMRVELNISKFFIPVTIGLAVLGQLAGSRIHRYQSV